MARAWAALIVLLVAGCTGPAADAPLPSLASPFAVTVGEAVSGQYYLLPHAGGDLVLRLTAGARASLDLFDQADARIGRYALGQMAATTDLRLQLPPEDYVIHFADLNGTLQATSNGRDVRLTPLATHVERHLLAQRPHSPVPSIPFVGRDLIEEPVDLSLARTPTAVRLVMDGGFGWLDLRLDGDGGPVFHARWRGAPVLLPFDHVQAYVPGTETPENARGPRLTGTLRVEDLAGALVLETSSYSRALPAGQERVGTHAGRAAFTYGLLPAQPVAFDAAPGATLLLWSEAPEGMDAWDDAGEGNQDEPADSWVALFGPDDRRVATALVKQGQATAVRLQSPGLHVAVLLSGNVTLGADRPPGGLGLRPLEVRTLDVPPRPAGSPGWYGQANETFAAEGVLYNAWPVELDAMGSSPFVFVCPAGESLVLAQHGETVGAWGPLWSYPQFPGILLDASPVTVLHDGYGDTGCPRLGLRLASYVR